MLLLLSAVAALGAPSEECLHARSAISRHAQIVLGEEVAYFQVSASTSTFDVAEAAAWSRAGATAARLTLWSSRRRVTPTMQAVVDSELANLSSTHSSYERLLRNDWALVQQLCLGGLSE